MMMAPRSYYRSSLSGWNDWRPSGAATAPHLIHASAASKWPNR